MCFPAVSINADMLSSFSKEDLRDLFPGPEHFFRKRDIWRITHDENEVMFDLNILGCEITIL